MDPGFIAPVVSVTGGDIWRMGFYAMTNQNFYSAYHGIERTGDYYLDGTTSFPMKPWESTDINGDGDYRGL